MPLPPDAEPDVVALFRRQVAAGKIPDGAVLVAARRTDPTRGELYWVDPADLVDAVVTYIAVNYEAEDDGEDPHADGGGPVSLPMGKSRVPAGPFNGAGQFW